jgi:hypothetical protein
MRIGLSATFLSLAILACGTPALAWGPEGHAIVADIAEAHLSAAARSEVAELLALEGHTHLDEVSSWADAVRPQRPETAPWHYVDIPLDASTYDAERDCPNDDCVVTRIVSFERILADTSALPADRLEALKWLVHFVGDIHQPLHAEDHGDRGGNDIRLTYFKQRTNLHAVWDGKIIEYALDLTLGPDYSFDHDAVRADARALNAAIADADRARWAPGHLTSNLAQAVVAWANESHALARTVAYPNLPAERRGQWAIGYQRAAWPVVQYQLERGGIRLAELLNESLDSRDRQKPGPRAGGSATAH